MSTSRATSRVLADGQSPTTKSLLAFLRPNQPSPRPAQQQQEDLIELPLYQCVVRAILLAWEDPVHNLAERFRLAETFRSACNIRVPDHQEASAPPPTSLPPLTGRYCAQNMARNQRLQSLANPSWLKVLMLVATATTDSTAKHLLSTANCQAGAACRTTPFELYCS